MEIMTKQVMMVLMLFAFGKSNAQFVGTGSQTDTTTTTTVMYIKNNALQLSWTDQKVNVKGFVVEQIREDYFWFEDATGRIKVEIEPRYMPAVPFNRNTELMINAEVCYPLIGRKYIGAKKIVFTGKKR
jgi:uncharacterized protein (TIGR00156 family)